jgi:hypothetical protein
MDARLSLKLDKVVVARAKAYAKKNRISLSILVEDYFKSLTKRGRSEKRPLSSRVKGLSGVLKLAPDFDLKTDRLSHLEDKYK